MRISAGEEIIIPRNSEEVVLRGPPRFNIVAIIKSEALITKRNEMIIEIPIISEREIVIRCVEKRNYKTGRWEYVYKFLFN